MSARTASGAKLPLLVITTVATCEQARSLAREMVERQLAACVQIAPVESFYRWQGKIENEAEYRVLFKTRAALYARLEAAIRERHPYALPAIHAIATAQAHAAYAEWVHDSTG